MATLPNLDKDVTKDPSPPAVDTQISPVIIPNGTTLITTKTTNETIDNVNQIIDYISGDAGPNFIPQNAIENLPSALPFAQIVKSVDEIVNNSNTPQDDDELSVPLNANKTYAYILYIQVISPSAADFKHTFSIPTGATGLRSFGAWSSQSFNSTFDITGVASSATNGANQWLAFTGSVKTIGTAGNLTLQWSQNVVDASDTTLEAGSYLLVWETSS